MKWLSIFLLLTIQGCAYTAVSAVSTVATGKSASDHLLSLSGNDCNTIKFLSQKQDYWCEQAREPGTTYNRNPY